METQIPLGHYVIQIRNFPHQFHVELWMDKSDKTHNQWQKYTICILVKQLFDFDTI